VTAYRLVVPGAVEAERLRGLIDGRALDVLTLASPSAAEGLLDLTGAAALDVAVAAIGPVTAEAAVQLGFNVVAVARPHTMEALAVAVTAWLSRSPREGPP
jgi:uroporphyrinogen-III synthase